MMMMQRQWREVKDDKKVYKNNFYIYLPREGSEEESSRVVFVSFI